jgi:hypothetical protein
MITLGISFQQVIQFTAAAMVSTLLIVAGVAKTISISARISCLEYALEDWLLLTLATSELALACVLVRNVTSRLVWVVICVVFGLFAVYSATQLGNLMSCGCIGIVKVPQAYMVAMDIAVSVIAGGVAIAGYIVPSESAQRVYWAMPSVVSIGTVVVIVCMVFLHLFSGPPYHPLFVTDKYLSVNELEVDTGRFSCVARVHNVTNCKARIVGLKPQCGVNYLVRSPVEFGPGDFIDIRVVSKLPNGKSRGVVSLGYFADLNGRLIEDELFFVVDLGQFARVVNSASKPGFTGGSF